MCFSSIWITIKHLVCNEITQSSFHEMCRGMTDFTLTLLYSRLWRIGCRKIPGKDKHWQWQEYINVSENGIFKSKPFSVVVLPFLCLCFIFLLMLLLLGCMYGCFDCIIGITGHQAFSSAFYAQEACCCCCCCSLEWVFVIEKNINDVHECFSPQNWIFHFKKCVI